MGRQRRRGRVRRRRGGGVILSRSYFFPKKGSNLLLFCLLSNLNRSFTTHCTARFGNAKCRRSLSRVAHGSRR